ncbi:MAG TPA: pseudouridine synthase [Bacteroidia bacterium]|nr:pseudouridine synthase [Bacteroidia bacterium]
MQNARIAARLTTFVKNNYMQRKNTGPRKASRSGGNTSRSSSSKKKFDGPRFARNDGTLSDNYSRGEDGRPAPTGGRNKRISTANKPLKSRTEDSGTGNYHSAKPESRGRKKPFERTSNRGEGAYSSRERKPTGRAPREASADSFEKKGRNPKPFTRGSGEDKKYSERKPSARSPRQGSDDSFESRGRAPKKPFRTSAEGDKRFSERKPSGRTPRETTDRPYAKKEAGSRKPFTRGGADGDKKFSSERRPSNRSPRETRDDSYEKRGTGFRGAGRPPRDAGEGAFERKPARKPYGKPESGSDKRTTRGDSAHAPNPYGRRSEPTGREADKRAARPSYRKETDERKPTSEKRYTRERSEERPSRTPRKTFSEKPYEKRSGKKNGKKETAGEEKEGTRLNKYIANAGICSRREADEYIKTGVVTVNGKVVTEMGYQVQGGDIVKFGERSIRPEKPVYILLNKPKDYITTLDDPEGRHIVTELINVKERVFPVGRLDRNTTGVLLLTNDGDLAERLMHPKYEVPKIYLAILDKKMDKIHMEQLMQGVELEDGVIAADDLAYVEGDKKKIGVAIHSGRNRIVHRMFNHLGYTVEKLDRTSYAGLTKQQLKRSGWRALTPEEVISLKRLVKLKGKY